MIRSLQALRGFAALAVFLFHLVPLFELSEAALFPTWLLRWGFSGVDVFFVLSGVVLTLTYASSPDTQEGLKRFYFRRFTRIYSGYWPFFFIMLAVAYALGFERMNDDSIIGSFLLTTTEVQHLVLGISWTLTYELYFYLLFGLIFLVGPRYFYAFVALYAVTVVLVNIAVPAEEGHTRFFLSHFVLEFFAGCLIGELYKRGRLAELYRPAWLLCIPFLVAGAYLNADRDILRSATFGVGAALLLCAFLGTEKVWSTRAGRTAVLLGDASFTLYLCHVIFIDVFHYAGYWIALRELGTFVVTVGNLAFILLVCGFSYGFYRYFEKPVYQRLTRRYRRT